MAKKKTAARITKQATPVFSGETTEQLVQRVKRDMLWVMVWAVTAVGMGLLVGQFVKI